MKKILTLFFVVILFFSCEKKDRAIIEEEKRPLQLTEAEAELWARLMVKDFNDISRINAERAALNADAVILELRKRYPGERP
jgi:hypothetical protein